MSPPRLGNLAFRAAREVGSVADGDVEAAFDVGVAVELDAEAHRAGLSERGGLDDLDSA